MLIFVYGTLRGGHFYMGDADFVTDGKAKGFTLVDLGAFPAMLPKAGGHVVGEVWNIDAEQIHVLDRFEGSCYHRQRIAVSVEGRKPLHAWAYVFRAGVPEDAETFSDWHRYVRT